VCEMARPVREVCRTFPSPSHRKSLKITEDHRRSLKITQDHSGSLRIAEDHRGSSKTYVRVLLCVWGESFLCGGGVSPKGNQGAPTLGAVVANANFPNLIG